MKRKTNSQPDLQKAKATVQWFLSGVKPEATKYHTPATTKETDYALARV